MGGFLVGIGTKLGNGCTSGHGVCGLPRFSIRSFAAVCSFMFTGFVLATFRYYVPFLNGSSWTDSIIDINYDITTTIVLILSIIGIVC